MDFKNKFECWKFDPCERKVWLTAQTVVALSNARVAFGAIFTRQVRFLSLVIPPESIEFQIRWNFSQYQIVAPQPFISLTAWKSLHILFSSSNYNAEGHWNNRAVNLHWHSHNVFFLLSGTLPSANRVHRVQRQSVPTSKVRLWRSASKCSLSRTLLEMDVILPAYFW